jgi:hypothetical protein
MKALLARGASMAIAIEKWGDPGRALELDSAEKPVPPKKRALRRLLQAVHRQDVEPFVVKPVRAVLRGFSADSNSQLRLRVPGGTA